MSGFSQKRIAAVSAVMQYTVGPAVAGLVTLTPTREWAAAEGRVITQLGGETLARLALRGGRSQSETYILTDAAEGPSLRIPAVLLKRAGISFRIADDGEAMTARKAAQKANARFEHKAAAALKELGLTFGN